MNRRNRILAGFLAVQLVLVAVVLIWQRPAVSGTDGQSLFPDVEAGSVTGLILTDAQGNSLQLANRGGAWVLPQAGDYPVQADKVPPLIEKIVGLTSDRLVTRTGGSHARLKVADDEYERLIELELADGSLRRLYVGTAPSFRATHIRAGGDDRVYLTSDLSVQDTAVDAASWVERIYMEVPVDDIVTLFLENANGRFEFQKVGEDTWAMAGLAAGETLNQGSVTALANRMRQVSVQQPLGKEDSATFGLGTPQAMVMVQTESEENGVQIYTLAIGAQDPVDLSYAVKSSESEYYVRVAEFSVQEFVETAREGLMVQPTPEPGAGAPASP